MAVWLDDLFDEHPKVQLLPDERAAWLHVRALLYCQRNPKTRGRFPKRMVPEMTKLPRPKSLAAMLATDYGEGVLWEDQGDFYKVHDWELYNQRAVERGEQLTEQQEARRAQARKAAEARWGPKPPASTSTRSASEEHAGSNALSIAGASGEQCPDDAMRTRGRAPDPSPSPNAPSLAEPHADGVLPACSERGADSMKPQASGPVLDRWLNMWPRQKALATGVIEALVEHLDETFVDEAIGHMIAMERPPRSPRYLTTICLDWSRQRGIFPADHPVFALGEREAS